MRVPFHSRDAVFVRWQRRGFEALRRVLQHLQQQLTVGRPREALALVPIRAMQPPTDRLRRRRTWRD